MSKAQFVALAITLLSVLALVVLRFVWAGSQLSSAAALGRLPRILPATLRRWLLGENGGRRFRHPPLLGRSPCLARQIA